MPIDFSQYVNLRPYDISPTAAYLDAIEYAKLVLPEFQLRQGTPEDAIIQAMSYLTSLNVSAINRLPDRLMSGILSMLGVAPVEGDRAILDVEFTAIDYDGTTIPQGTIVRYDYEFLNERESIYFETTEETVISAVEYTGVEPLPTVVVETRAIDVGQILPISAGTELIIDTPTFKLLSASVDSLVSQGSNRETSEEYLNRAVKYLASLSSSFARASQIESYVTSQYAATITRCKVYDLTDSAGDLLFTDPEELGYVTAFVYGKNALATENQKTDALIGINARTVAGLSVGIVDVNIVDLEITIEAGYNSTYDSTVVSDNIETVLSSYFSPDNYRFSESIKFSEFYSVISSVPGIVYVSNVVVTTSNPTASVVAGQSVDFDTKGSLPRINVSDINVTLTSVTS